MAGCAAEPIAVEDGRFPADCNAGDPAAQRWGTDCLCCHDGEFGVAGSVAPGSGVVEVRVSDARHEVVAAPNLHDNFFRHLALEPPLTARIVMADGSERAMSAPAPDGACNRCHDGVELPLLGETR